MCPNPLGGGGLTLRFLFEILSLWIPDLFQFGFSLVIQFLHVLNCFRYLFELSGCVCARMYVYVCSQSSLKLLFTFLFVTEGCWLLEKAYCLVVHVYVFILGPRHLEFRYLKCFLV